LVKRSREFSDLSENLRFNVGDGPSAISMASNLKMSCKYNSCLTGIKHSDCVISLYSFKKSLNKNTMGIPLVV
jgi:tRNA (Thr-GGU) A37 N-methylase